jgi:hypothetical protein
VSSESTLFCGDKTASLKEINGILAKYDGVRPGQLNKIRSCRHFVTPAPDSDDDNESGVVMQSADGELIPVFQLLRNYGVDDCTAILKDIQNCTPKATASEVLVDRRKHNVLGLLI